MVGETIFLQKKENHRPILRIHVVHMYSTDNVLFMRLDSVRLTAAKSRTRIILVISGYPIQHDTPTTAATFGRISRRFFHISKDVAINYDFIHSYVRSSVEPPQCIYLPQIGRNRTLAFKIIHAPGTQLHQGLRHTPLRGGKKEKEKITPERIENKSDSAMGWMTAILWLPYSMIYSTVLS